MFTFPVPRLSLKSMQSLIISIFELGPTTSCSASNTRSAIPGNPSSQFLTQFFRLFLRRFTHEGFDTYSNAAVADHAYHGFHLKVVCNHHRLEAV